MSDCMMTVLPCKEEVYAVRAVAAGTADERQQKVALAYIVKHLSRAHILAFVPGSHDQTAFLAGRQYVGKKIIEMTELPVGKIKVIDPEKPQKEAGNNE